MADNAVRATTPWRRGAGVVRGLSWADRVVAVEAWLLISIARAILRLTGTRRLIAWMAGAPRRSTRRVALDAARAGAIARLVAMASRHTPVAHSCLHRSLTLWWLLGRRGFPADLVLGARKEHGQLTAHAWVEFRGQPLDDEPAQVAGYIVWSRTRHA